MDDTPTPQSIGNDGPIDEVSHWLLPVSLRLARAREINAQIQAALPEYREPDAFEIEHVIRGGVTDLVLRVHRPAPPRLALLVGEGVHQMRAALDNLVVLLADRAAGITLPDGEIKSFQFPIADTKAKFDAQAKGCLKGLPEDVVSRIEAVQPYHRLDDVLDDPQPIRHIAERLHLLRELSNHDKHRRINVLLHRAGTLAVHHSSAVSPTITMNRGCVRDGDVVATVETLKVQQIDVTTELAVAHPITGQPLLLKGFLEGLLWAVEFQAIPHITDEDHRFGPPPSERTPLD